MRLWFAVNSVKLLSASSKPRWSLPRGTKFLTLRSTLAHSPVLDAIVEQAENNQAWKFTETMAFSQSESGSPVRKMAGQQFPVPSLFFCFSILQKDRHCDTHQPTFPGKNETTFGCDQDTPPSHLFLQQGRQSVESFRIFLGDLPEELSNDGAIFIDRAARFMGGSMGLGA